jgi:ferredoxin
MKDSNKGVSKIVYLKFPPERSGRPVVCNLARLYDLTFNILQASIGPRSEGRMTIELLGSEDSYRKGIDYLKDQGIKIEPAAQKISRDEDSCVHCGLCTSLCPTQALHLDPETRVVLFDPEACTACGQCTRICPVKAMNVLLDDNGN